MKVYKTKEAFMQNTRFNELTGCMEWLHYKNADGYGRLMFEGKVQSAHRIAYRLFNGEINNGLVVRHKCHNPACCNPEHLDLGTQQDNIMDMVLAGRNKTQNRKKPKPEGFGEKLSCIATRLWKERKERGIYCLNKTKLNDEDVREIRRLRQDGTPFKHIAEMYKVTDTSIRNIISRKTWDHVR
jgi:hypothetical protein